MLVVMSAARIDLQPDVPTISEAGYKEVETINWQGVVAPAKMTKEIATQLINLFVSATTASDVKAQLVGQGMVPAPVCGADFSTLYRGQHQYFVRYLRELNIKGE